MNPGLQIDRQGRLVHLLTTEGLPAEMIRHILDTAAQFVSVNEREVKKVLLVAIVSNRGLAGAFNTQVFRLVRKAVDDEFGIELPTGKKTFTVVAIRYEEVATSD